METHARVTNLENGKKVEVTINDRGPFAKDRNIDLSHGNANKLGCLSGNTQRFHVRAFPASKWGALHFGGPKRGHIGARVYEFGPIVGLDARLGR